MVAPLIKFEGGDHAEALFDLPAVDGDNATSVIRRFVNDSSVSLQIEDQIEISNNMQQIFWQLITTAEVKSVRDGAVLRQSGKVLHLQNLSHPESKLKVVSLDASPLALDKHIKGLNRLEPDAPITATDEKIVLHVRLFER